MAGGTGVRGSLTSSALVAVALLTASCNTDSPGLVLLPIGNALPTHIDRLPRGLSTSPHSASCHAARVAHSRPQRYSLLVTLQGFVNEPAKAMPMQYVALGVRIHTATRTYTTYLSDLDEISYEPPSVQLRVEGISEESGGFGVGGVFVPLPASVSRKLLLAGQERNYTQYDPATTMTLDEPPTSCDVIVNGGYQQDQTIDIPLGP